MKLELNNKIKANVIQASLYGYPLIFTYEIELPRIILAELNTHKILVRNSQSSRAVPVKRTIEQLYDNMFIPSYWGKKQAGMSASEECNEEVKLYSYEHETITNYKREHAWIEAADKCIEFANAYDEAGYHKQIVNRLIEPFQMIKIVITGTEWDNFFNLRIHKSTEPHFRDLAIKMFMARRRAIENGDVLFINPGEWHLPYINRRRNSKGVLEYFNQDNQHLSLEEAQKVSLSCCAQTSYRRHDDSIEKAEGIIGKLFEDGPVHGSPAEHLATPMKDYSNDVNNAYNETWEPGVTHLGKDGYLWSAQFKNWIQYRQLIPNHVCTRFTESMFEEYTRDIENINDLLKKEME